ncbi:MAG: sulfatase-like hydrolase/transferase [Betaproteobacteria bacterium]
MPSARKRAAPSPKPRGPARGPAASAERRRRPPALAAAGAMLAVLGAAAWWWWPRTAPQVDLHPIARQNVLLVTIDTLRADALDCYGGPARTPALDRLATEGVRFTFAHAQAPLTLPSHTSILTGEYPYQHGVRENSGYRLAPGARTLATILKSDGYATGAFVSAFPLNSRFGLNQGFDVYDDHVGETRSPTEFVMPERPGTATVAIARPWIAARQRDGGRPWFAWVHVFDPHAPYQPPPPFDREYADRPYYGEVAAADSALAPLLDDVRRAPQPTLVVVTGDHGEALGDHGEATHGLFAYESTLRIPLIVAEVGGGRPESTRGEVSDVPVRHVDLLPTILDAVGQRAPEGLPGRTLLPAAERRDGAAPRPSYFEAMSAMLNRGWAPLTGIVAGRDKYIDLPIPELYNLARDPGEQTNLVSRDADRARVLQTALRGFHAALPGQRQTEDPKALAELQALGYISGEAPLKAHYTEADDPKRLVDLDAALHRGVELYGEHRLPEAEHVYQAIISRRPDMSVAYRHLAFVHWESGDVRGAVDVLRRAIQAHVRDDGITAQLANYLAETGDPEEAVRLLAPVAQEQTPDLDALNALGIAYARSGRPKLARQVFERMLDASPASGMAFENLGALDLGENDLAAARQHFTRAVQLDPRSSQAHAGLGVVAVKSGDRQQAVAEWRKAVELDPTNFDALYNLATTLEDEGQREAARPYLDQFVRTAPPALYGPEIRQLSAVMQK